MVQPIVRYLFISFLGIVALYAPLHTEQILHNWADYLGFSWHAVNRQSSLNAVREMFDFAYSSYMNHAFPLDELDPIHCTGRGYDHANPNNINVNDALGDYHLTLVDSLDTLVLMGRLDEFKQAVDLLVNNLSFERNVRVQVFEATIRVLGGLLSAHLLITDPRQPFGNIRPAGYQDELLLLAHDLANRMLNAFDSSPSGLPYPRFYLDSGLKDNTTTENCLAGAGSLLLEFGCLSALLNDPTYASVAKRVVLRLWKCRSSVTDLLGATIDVESGKWINRMSGLGAGHDSFYEYLHKSSILFDDRQMGTMFEESLSALRYHLVSGGPSCVKNGGVPSIYWNVDMYTGNKVNYWIDSLQSAWPAILAHHGDVNEAVCQHAVHYFIWQLFGLPPERYDVASEKALLRFYPLRPEFAESTYYLYRTTRHPFYLHVGQQILENLNKYARARCGFATIHDVVDMSQEDRMESFFLSETLKYLYLLFDEKNPVNVNEEDYVFSTQAHLFPIRRIRSLVQLLSPNPFKHSDTPVQLTKNVNNRTCASPQVSQTYLPLDRTTWESVAKFVHSRLDLYSI